MKLLFPLWLLIASSHLNPYFASYKKESISSIGSTKAP